MNAMRNQLLSQLLKAFQEARLPHLLLFIGAPRTGRFQFLKNLAQSMSCSQLVGDGQACGVCGSCLRSQKEQWDNVILVGDQQQKLKMEDAQRIHNYLQLRALDHRPRIILIRNIEQMTVQASNSLLKLFEEPPDNCYFFLLSPGIGGVLPTIRSRCQIVRMLGRPTEDAIDEQIVQPLASTLLHSQVQMEEIDCKDREQARTILNHWRIWLRNQLMGRDRKGRFGLQTEISLAPTVVLGAYALVEQASVLVGTQNVDFNLVFANLKNQLWRIAKNG